MRNCPCGSGLPRYELYDRAGIFCTFVCDKCEKEKRSHYNPAIFESHTYNGTEDSLEAADYEHEF